MTTKSLTVHDTGPDGESTYELVIGRDITADVAEEVIGKSGSYEVYAMHLYEAGERVEHFVSKAMYDRFRAEIAPISARRRSFDEIKSAVEQRTPKAEEPHKSWWAFWR